VKKAVILCVLAFGAPSDAGEPFAMRLSPNVALEPALMTVRAVVEADTDNRALQIIAESPNFYRSSVIQLDGANAPRLNVFEFKNLPTGTYEITGILLGTHGPRVAVSRLFRVAPAPGSAH
jgi:hypothetical protein